MNSHASKKIRILTGLVYTYTVARYWQGNQIAVKVSNKQYILMYNVITQCLMKLQFTYGKTPGHHGSGFYFGGSTLRALKKIVEGNQLIHLDASLPRFFLSYCFNLQCSAICSAAGWCLNQPNAGFYKPRIVQHTQQLQEIFS